MWDLGTGAKTALGIVTVLFLLAQLPSVERTNPPPAGDLQAPPAVESILKRACYDCHSNQTRWPWYAYVAPMSWIVAHHVAAGRRELNFSEWGRYYPATRRRKLQWMARAVGAEQMPPWYYRAMHPEARLTAEDRAALLRWIEQAQAKLSSSAKEK